MEPMGIEDINNLKEQNKTLKENMKKSALRVEDLLQQNEKLKLENDQWYNHYKQSNETIRRYKAWYEEAKADVDTYKRENENFTADFQYLNTLVDQKEIRINNLHATNEKLQAENDKLKSENETLKTNSLQIQKWLEEERADNDKLQQLYQDEHCENLNYKEFYKLVSDIIKRLEEPVNEPTKN